MLRIVKWDSFKSLSQLSEPFSTCFVKLDWGATKVLIEDYYFRIIIISTLVHHRKVIILVPIERQSKIFHRVLNIFRLIYDFKSV